MNMNIPSIEDCARYLRAKRVTLWQSWDITDDDGLYDAATWLRDQIVGVHGFLGNEPTTKYWWTSTPSSAGSWDVVHDDYATKEGQ